jgi:hypothetical protein
MTYLATDKGANHFSGDFTHLIDIYCTSFSGADAQWHIWAVGDSLNDRDGVSNELMVSCYRDGTTTKPTLLLEEKHQGIGYGQTYYIPLQYSITYYLTISRSGTNFSCKVYSDSARTTQIGNTISITLHGVVAYQYVYGVQALHVALSGRTANGYCENLNLQETGQPPTNTGNLQVIGYADQTAVEFSAYYVGPSGQGSTVTVPASGYTWSSLAPGTYTVYGTYNGIQKNQQVTVVAGQTAPATLTFSGTAPPDIISIIKNFFNNPSVRQLLLIAGLLMTAIGGIMFILPGEKHYAPPPPPRYY